MYFGFEDYSEIFFILMNKSLLDKIGVILHNCFEVIKNWMVLLLIWGILIELRKF